VTKAFDYSPGSESDRERDPEHDCDSDHARRTPKTRLGDRDRERDHQDFPALDQSHEDRPERERTQPKNK